MPVIVPSRGDSHMNRMLTDVSVAFGQDPNGFVADKFFRTVSVSKSADAVAVIPRGAWNRNNVRKRAPGTLSSSVTWEHQHDLVYNCVPSALSTYIPWDILDDEDDSFDQSEEATIFLTQQMLIERDVAFAADFMTTGVWTGLDTGVAAAPGANQVLQWNDADSTPIEDVREAITGRAESTGIRMNVMALGRRVYDALIDHPDIVARVNQGQTPGGPAMVNKRRLEEIFELEEILVMDGVVNTAIEGATDAHSFIGGKTALLGYRPPKAGLRTPASGYTFAWRGAHRQNGPQGWSIEQWQDRDRRADKVEANQAYDQFRISADLGHFFNTVVA